MNRFRRVFLKLAGGLGALAAVGGTALVRPMEAWAAPWNKAGFESKAFTDALKSLGAASATESRDIAITAPDIAENGAVVPIAVTSRIPGTQQISILAAGSNIRRCRRRRGPRLGPHQDGTDLGRVGSGEGRRPVLRREEGSQDHRWRLRLTGDVTKRGRHHG